MAVETRVRKTTRYLESYFADQKRGKRVSTPEEKKEMGDLVCVKTFNNRIEAGFEMNILESEGIFSLISADDCGGAYSALSKAYGGIKLLVKKEDLQRADNILKNISKE